MYDANRVKPPFTQLPSPGQVDTTLPLTFSQIYTYYSTQWEENYACYQGIDGIVRSNLLGKHPRESEDSWQYRKGQLCSPNYTKGIVDAYTAHLQRKQGMVHQGALKDNELFTMFLEDCDYNNTNFLDLFSQEAPYCSLFGGVGYLTDMPAFDIAQSMSLPEATARKIYPYVSTYYPPNILDWLYVRDEWGRPVLVFLKLLDDDGYIRVWWDMGDSIVWEVYQASISVLTTAVGQNSMFALSRQRTLTEVPKKISEGSVPVSANRIKYIPFEFQYNRNSGIKMIGLSDVGDISRLDVRIVNDLSRIGEIADIAAFPIMLLPRHPAGEAPAEQVVSPTGVLPKGPGPDDTPEWLAAEVAEPINALWMDIDKCREEIYRVALFGGMEQQGVGMATGPALNFRFQQLGARLMEKSRSAEEVANGILYHWQSWLGMEAAEDTAVQMPKDYNIEDLAADLDAVIKATAFVDADAFTRECRKVVVNKVLPSLPEDTEAEIEDEITQEFIIEEAQVDDTGGVAEKTPNQPVQPGNQPNEGQINDTGTNQGQTQSVDNPQ